VDVVDVVDGWMDGWLVVEPDCDKVTKDVGHGDDGKGRRKVARLCGLERKALIFCFCFCSATAMA
jgi:hypothetical protein